MSKTRPAEPAMSAWAQLQALRRDFLGYLLDAAKLGDLVLLRPAPGVKIWLVNHPELIHEILVTRAAQVKKSAMTNKMVSKFLGQGLVLAEGEVHRQQRRAVQPSFRGSTVEALSPAIEHATTTVTASWRDGEAVEIESTMTGLSLLVIARLLFGDRAGGQNQASLEHAMEQFADSMAQRFRSMPLPEWLPTARHRAERAAIEVLDRAITDQLEDPPRDGLVAELLAAGIARAQIRDQIATLYFAGHETTAKWLTWTLWLIARDGELELDRRLAEDPGGELLDRVLRESLRLYPPTWVFDRETTTELELGGCSIPKGSTLYLSPWVSHRDPRFFAAPEQFQPDRFVDGFEAGLPRGAYYPFGFGPRNCVGRRLAELNARVALRSLLERGALRSLRVEVRPQPAATLRPAEPLYLTVHAR